ncbi:hypothetical protein Esti_003336 [Eimeria stiedai]
MQPVKQHQQRQEQQRRETHTRRAADCLRRWQATSSPHVGAAAPAEATAATAAAGAAAKAAAERARPGRSQIPAISRFDAAAHRWLCSCLLLLLQLLLLLPVSSVVSTSASAIHGAPYTPSSQAEAAAAAAAAATAATGGTAALAAERQRFWQQQQQQQQVQQQRSPAVIAAFSDAPASAMRFSFLSGCHFTALLLLCPFTRVQQQQQQQANSSSSSSSVVFAGAYEQQVAASLPSVNQQQHQHCSAGDGAAAAAAAAGVESPPCPSLVASPPLTPAGGLGALQADQHQQQQQQQQQQRRQQQGGLEGVSLLAVTLPMEGEVLSNVLGQVRLEPLSPYARVLERLNAKKRGSFTLAVAKQLISAALKNSLSRPLSPLYLKQLLHSIDLDPRPQQQQQQQQQEAETLELPQVLRLLQLVGGGDTVSSGALEGLLVAESDSFISADSPSSDSPAAAAAAAAGEGMVRRQLETLAAEYARELSLFYSRGMPYLFALHMHSKTVRNRLLLQLQLHQQQQQKGGEREDVVPPSLGFSSSRAIKLVEQRLPHLVAAAVRDSNSSTNSSSKRFELRLDVVEALLKSLIRASEASFLFSFADGDGSSCLDTREFFSVLLLQQLHGQQLLQAATAAAMGWSGRVAAVLESPWASPASAGSLDAAVSLRQQQLLFVAPLLFAAVDMNGDSCIDTDEFVSFLQHKGLLLLSAAQLHAAGSAALYL